MRARGRRSVAEKDQMVGGARARFPREQRQGPAAGPHRRPCPPSALARARGGPWPRAGACGRRSPRAREHADRAAAPDRASAAPRRVHTGLTRVGERCARPLQRWMHIRNLPGLEYKTFVGGGGPRASTFTQEQPANQKRCVAAPAPCAAAETFPCAPHPRRGHRHAGRLPRPSRPDRCVLRAVLREPWRRRPATGGSAPPVATSAPTRRPLRAEAAWGVLKGKLEGLRRDGKFRLRLASRMTHCGCASLPPDTPCWKNLTCPGQRARA